MKKRRALNKTFIDANGSVHIQLTQGLHTIVDANQLNRLSKYKWHVHESSHGKLYPRTQLVGGQKVRMHEMLIKRKDKCNYIDHKDGDTMNNRLSNLREVTPQESRMNQKKRKGCTSKYKGVCAKKNTNKWIAYIKIDGKTEFLGTFDKEGNAALKYNERAAVLFGEHAMLNKVDELKSKGNI